jgi:hypothetical protein
MKQAECEQLVDRYMSGDMSVSEEQDFFIQVAVNDELRQTLKAYRVVDTALRKDRSVPRPAGNDRSRANIMAMLAATAPIAGAGAGAAGSGVAADAIAHGTTAATMQAGAAGSAGLISSGIAKIGALLIAVTGLTVGTFVVGPVLSDRVATTTPTATRTVTPSMPPSAGTQGTEGTKMMERDSAQEVATARPVEAGTQPTRTVEELRPRPTATTMTAHRNTAAPQQAVTTVPRVAAHQDSVPATRAEVPRPVPSKVDSISFKVDIELPDDK